ncbi:MAG: redoxin domain-containing protein [Campylobacteraceae bacterium]|nr:redoxin domain-containing protein [Campylobacteraceae bacterium]
MYSLFKDALQVGDIAKDFILPNAVNKLISLSNELKNNDYIVLNFYRGSWCPYCNIELNALKKIYEY